ncbi:MAG: MBL fold metallo-hydrolase, partial [Anaerolineales bacterium]|nr:MBL fold metallo-hydrolase [Anaerolineales bacterium]
VNLGRPALTRRPFLRPGKSAVAKRKQEAEAGDDAAAVPSFAEMGVMARRPDLLLAIGVVGILVVFIMPLPPLALDMLLAEGDTISFGTYTFQVLFTPGHTIGHVSFYEASAGIIFDGDVLFAGGIGRTDLPGGDYETLIASINDKLMTLPDETVVCSGHGPITTIGRERASNPWL